MLDAVNDQIGLSPEAPHEGQKSPSRLHITNRMCRAIQ